MLITNFAAGELSKTLFGRADLQQYYSGASEIVNWDIIPTGGIKRRKGSRYLSNIENGCRLIPFVISNSISYLLEIAPDSIRIWKNGKKLTDTDGNEIKFENLPEIELYHSLDDIREVQYAQNYDTMIFVHRDYPPLELKYIGLDSFTLSKMQFDFTPDEEISDIHNQYKPEEEEDTEVDTETFQTFNNYPGCVAFYLSRLWFASTRKSPQKIWASKAPDENGVRYNQFATTTKFISVTRQTKDADLHIFTGNLRKNSNLIEGVTQDLRNALKKDFTEYYVTGKGIPIGTKVTGISETQITMSNKSVSDLTDEPITIQLWKTSDYATSDDFEYNTQIENITMSSDSFNFEIASNQNDTIKWLANTRLLIVGTENSEWIIPSEISANNLYTQLNSRYGSSELQATTVGEGCIFFGAGKKTMREYYYNANNASFMGNNIAQFNPEILLESAVVDFDFTQNPNNRIICTKEDGTLAILLYEKNSGVMAWYRYKHAKGKIISVATVANTDGTDDIYCVVCYGNNDTGYSYTLEVIEDKEIYLDNYTDYTQMFEQFYDDDAVIYNKSKNTWCKVADGIPEDFIDVVDDVYIGYMYESSLKSMPVLRNSPSTQKRISDIQFRFLDSYMPCLYRDDVKESLSNIVEPFTGQHKVSFPGNWDKDVFFTIKTDKPFNTMILSVDAMVV
jgi:hypothetical protein